jgi:3-hydroxyisobutyrate dehydrogenase
MASEHEKVAFLGIGAMGYGMATSALRAGLPTVVWNREPEATKDLGDLGADVADTAAAAAAGAGIVVTMVTNADAVVSIATDQRMLDALAPGAIWAQMSTIGVSGTERVATLVESRRHDVTVLDAPVSGSKEPAEQGKLTIFASGPDDARPRVAPLFDALGERTVWVGAYGAGSRLKLVNNTLLAFTAEGVAASIALAHGLGLDTGTVIDALGGGPLMSPWEAAKLQRIAKDEYSPQFALSLALKDVHLALEAVDPERFEAFASLASEWERAVDHGLGTQDVTVVTRALEGSGGEP